MKKTISAALCALLALSLSMVAFAADVPADTPVDAAAPSAAQKAYPVRMSGTIVEETNNTAEEKRTIVVQNDANAEDSVVLHVDFSTCIVDAETGLPASVEDRTNDKVIVYYGPAATFSLPPQSNAVVIAVNVPEKSVSPHYAVVESVEMSEDNNSVKVLTDNGSVFVTINRDAPISPYLTRNIVTIDNIREGTELLMWYEMMAMSHPAQAASSKTVIVRDAPVEVVVDQPADEASPASPPLEGIILSPDAGVASINGVETDLIGIRYSSDGETPLLPLRQVCEALGYEVKWVTGTDKVQITKDSTTVLLQFFKSTYTKNGINVVTSHASIVENGVTYAPTDFFTQVLEVPFTLITTGV